MNRIVKVLRSSLPSLLGWPGYREDEREVLTRVVRFTLQQAEQLSRDARLVTDVKID